MKKALFSLFLFSFTVLTAVAQPGPNGGIPYPTSTTYAGYTPHLIEEVLLEEYVYHYDSIVDPLGFSIPQGSVTYRMYLKMKNPTDYVSAVGAAANGSFPLLISSTSGFYNHPLGGSFGANLNPAFFAILPAVQFDTFVTFQATSSATDCGGISTLLAPFQNLAGETNPALTFGPPGGDLAIVAGGWYHLSNGNICGFGTGPDNKVLIGQFTTNGPGNISWQLGMVSVIEGNIPGQVQSYVGGLHYNLYTSADGTLAHYYEDASGIPGWCGSTGGLNECPTTGCTDPSACNYQPNMTIDNGSCLYQFGCINPIACNYDPEACYAVGVCVYPGCTDPAASNYNPSAGCDDGSCHYPCQGACEADFNGDGVITFADMNTIIDNFGCMGDCPGDVNGDGVVSFNDLTMFFTFLGCECP